MNQALQFFIHHGHSVIFVWVLTERLGAPIPVSPILLGAGALAGLGQLNFSVILTVATTASLLGDLLWYLLGRVRGHRVLSFLCRLSLDQIYCVRRTKTFFSRYGLRSVLVARFIPGLGTFSAPLAGASRMRLSLFLLLNGLGTFCWVCLFTGLGYQFSHEIHEHLATHPLGATPWMGLIVPFGMGGFVLWKYLRRRRFLRQLATVRISPEEVKRRLDAGEDILIIDLRDGFEFHLMPQTIPGAFRMSIEELEKEHHKIPRDREVVLFCN